MAREECEPVRRGRKLRMAVAAKAVETKASFGHTRSIEVCVGVAVRTGSTTTYREINR
uniref:hypothetical protein n=1 Tax=Agrobacterium fabrum TaxID=1176649 RepID=UPI0021BD7C5C|nr:hypothetical protein [Agrobacterium fabrum]